MNIRNILGNPWFSHGVAGVLSAAVGAGTVYLLVHRPFKKEVADFWDEMFSEIEAGTETVEQAAEWVEEAARKLQELDLDDRHDVDDLPDNVTPFRMGQRSFGEFEDAKREAAMAEHPSAADPEPEHHSIFLRPEDNGWDYDVELSKRTDNAPYVIHKDEFFGDETAWDSQSTLTYYVGDDVLADEHDAPIYDVSATIGEVKFGHGSGDPNVFYVRNPRLKAEYEIIRHTGRFDVEVLGHALEDQYEAGDLKHSNAPLRMRREIGYRDRHPR